MEKVWPVLLDYAARAKAGEVLPIDPVKTMTSEEVAFFELYRPLLAARWSLGQLGQSLDGYIATAEGQSHYVTGTKSLVHLHRLRALADAVVVGTSTAEADDPQLTTRHVDGPSPTRVILDRTGRLPAHLRAYSADGNCLRITAPGVSTLEGVESLELPEEDGGFTPQAVIASLAERGLTRLLIEGGGKLVTSWYRAGALDRLHVVTAPIFLGAGRKGLDLPPVTDLPSLHRPPARHYSLGEDVLFDLDLRA